MHIHNLEAWRHGHVFLDVDANQRNERRTLYVVALTSVMMVAEIGAGWAFNSMALLADGWHMASHAGALGLTVFAYRYARRHLEDRRFTFGIGKVEILGGFASAVVLAVIAGLMAWESVARLINPVAISYDEATVVAILGLAVNIVSAGLLVGAGGNGHAGHDHGDGSGGGVHDDHNLRAAYVHVLADALTSILAIVALVSGKVLGWAWMDAAVGIVGAAVIATWAFNLLRDSGRILLDHAVDDERTEDVRRAIEADADNRIVDLHLWRVGPQRLAAIVSLVTHEPRPPQHYRALVGHLTALVHVTVEVNPCVGEPCVPTAARNEAETA